jgi:hypothetical protein
MVLVSEPRYKVVNGVILGLSHAAVVSVASIQGGNSGDGAFQLPSFHCRRLHVATLPGARILLATIVSRRLPFCRYDPVCSGISVISVPLIRFGTNAIGGKRGRYLSNCELWVIDIFVLV